MKKEVKNMSKRKEYLSWDEYFMGLAFLSAMRSKDPSTQVGACIIDEDRKIIGIGYNGFPMGSSDDDMPWERNGENPVNTKYMYVCHAELNAILNRSSGSLEGAKLYVTLFPCNECAKAIIQSGIKEVVYMSDKYADEANTIASKKMFDMVGIKYRIYEKTGRKLTIEL